MSEGAQRMWFAIGDQERRRERIYLKIVFGAV